MALRSQRTRWLAVAAALAPGLLTAAPAGAEVFIPADGFVSTEAVTYFDDTRAVVRSLPDSGTVRDIESYSTTSGEISWQLSGDAFAFQLRHHTEGATVNEYGTVMINSWGTAETRATIRFEVDRVTSYELSGQHGTSDNAWRAIFDVEILKLPSQDEQFSQYFNSNEPPISAKFNSVEGLGERGVLYPGVLYEFRFRVGINTPLTFQQDVSALGRLDLVFTPGSGSGDGDRDGLFDVDDNCPDRQNLDQLDGDEDAVGDVCDPFPEDPNNAAAQLAVDIESCQSDLASTRARLQGCESSRESRARYVSALEQVNAERTATIAALEDEHAALAAEAERLRETIDSDGDGVPDVRDACPDSVLPRVDSQGCTRRQRRAR